MAPEVRKIVGPGGLSSIHLTWEDNALSIYSPEYDEWTMQGKDGEIYYAGKDSEHYKACMEAAGIEVRKN